MFSIVASMPAKGAVGGREDGMGAGVSTLATRAPVAQGIERAPPEREVEGSNPSGRMCVSCSRVSFSLTGDAARARTFLRAIQSREERPVSPAAIQRSMTA
jgi:hypothetical protein